MLYPELNQFINNLDIHSIASDRRKLLSPLLKALKHLKEKQQPIRLNFICTHNSRRSHLAQCWAQAISHYLDIEKVFCYSGGTEATAVFPEVLHALEAAGFQSQLLAAQPQATHAIKYCATEQPIVAFSKKYDNHFNPQTNYVAIMVCSDAEQNCPVVHGASSRFSIPYDDPKIADGSPEQAHAYLERSQQIATELLFLFTQITQS